MASLLLAPDLMRKPLYPYLASNDTAALDPLPTVRDEQIDATVSSLVTDLDLVRRCRANTLIVGPKALTSALLALLRPWLDGAVKEWPFEVSHDYSDYVACTIIIQDVDCVSPSEQEQLLQLLDASELHLRVIALSERPVFLLVEQGAFREALYRRLNILIVDVTSLYSVT